LLSQGTRAVPPAERPEHRQAVRTAQVVALSAAAVVQERFAAMGVADRAQAGGDFGDRGVPADLVGGAVGAAAQRAQDATVVTVLVVVEAQRLLAGVALAGGVGLVAADPLEAARGGHPRVERRVARRAEAHL